MNMKKSAQRSPGFQKTSELFQAYNRIGKTPEKGLAWILSLCEEDLSRLSAGDWQNLLYEVLWFSVWGPPIPGAIPSGDDLQDLSMNPNKNLPTEKFVYELQKWAKTHLDEFIEKWETKITLQQSSALVVKRDRKLGRAEMFLKTDDLKQGFQFSFTQILRVAGARLNQCPQCLKYYSARLNQTYCSPRCQNRVSLAKFRDAQQTKKQAKKKSKPSKRG